MERNLERISCKAALYNFDNTKVLLVEYRENEFGLPGGHIETDEEPDGAITRELKEELNLEGVTLKLKDAWRHPNGKIVLGYRGVLDENSSLTIDVEEIRSALWVDLSDIKNGAISAGTYDRFILQFVGE